jgi:2-methylisocitrate lyase-like PEP mutase family enzyme
VTADSRTRTVDEGPDAETSRSTTRTPDNTKIYPGDVLRELLADGPILELPSICDPLGARLAQEAGYEAVALAGYAVGAHMPLTRSLSIDDVERATAAVAAVCSVPLLVDADAGWGSADQVPDAVARLAAAGAGAVQLSSQHIPDRVPYSDRAERRISRRELVDRVSAAAGARDQILVMARCDVAEDDYDEAVRHVEDLLTAGADAILVYSACEDEVQRLPNDLSFAPLIYAGHPEETFGLSVRDTKQLEQWSYRAVRNKYHRCYCARMLDQRRGTPVDRLG